MNDMRFRLDAGCASDLELDRLVAGEIERRPHLDDCARCGGRLAELERFRRTYAATIPGRTAAHRRRGRLEWAAAVGLAAALLLVPLLAPDRPATRTKGVLALQVVARRLDGRIEDVLPGGKLRPGEAIRFRVRSARAGYLVVAAVDAAPNVTVYYPHEAPSLPIGANEDVVLDGSITLDETLGRERIVAVLCDEPPDPKAIAGALEAALTKAGGDPNAVDLTLGCPVTAFSIEKIGAP